MQENLLEVYRNVIQHSRIIKKLDCNEFQNDMSAFLQFAKDKLNRVDLNATIPKSNLWLK
jgi:hypothetical protein